MPCQHIAINSKIDGNESTCILCGVSVIFDAPNWVYVYSISGFKRELLRYVYRTRDRGCSTPGCCMSS